MDDKLRKWKLYKCRTIVYNLNTGILKYIITSIMILFVKIAVVNHIIYIL